MPCMELSGFGLRMLSGKYCILPVKIFKLDYTCRARWPEELLCCPFKRINFFKIHIVQIFKINIVQISKSEKLQHVSSILHLKYVHKKSKITPFSRNAPSDRHRQTDTIHTSFSSTQTVSRKHNSPSGNNGLDFVPKQLFFGQNCG